MVAARHFEKTQNLPRFCATFCSASVSVRLEDGNFSDESDVAQELGIALDQHCFVNSNKSRETRCYVWTEAGTAFPSDDEGFGDSADEEDGFGDSDDGDEDGGGDGARPVQVQKTPRCRFKFVALWDGRRPLQDM